MTILDRLSGPEAPAPAYTPPFTLTEEQTAIISAAESSNENLIVEALAGAAKTSTLVVLAQQPKMARIPTLCLAFNKRIAEEMRARLPSNCESMTLNSLGHRVWGKAIGKRLTLDTKKNYDIMQELIKAEKNQNRKDALFDSFSDLLRTFAHGKSSGWVPDECQKRNRRLLSNEDFFAGLDEELEPAFQRLLIDSMLVSINQAYSGKIDFDDQIFMSTCFPSQFPDFPLTMIDEAQDLSALNHEMLELIVGGNRLIAVGDPCQAIYAFRGAFGDSMERLRERFSMRVLRLSTSFRCPQAIVREAQWRAPHMTWPDWAKPGEVRSFSDWSVDMLPQNAVIICRNNAPLFSIAIKLLIEGRFPQLVGNDIGKSLIKVMSKLGPRETPAEAAREKLSDYRLKRLSRTRDHAKGSVEDFCLCIQVFIDRNPSLGAAIDYANHLMNVVGLVKLMTGHKSKGLEFKSVFILDRQLLRLDAEGGKNQDRNLLYVMQTRSQETLTYIASEQLIMTEGKKEEIT